MLNRKIVLTMISCMSILCASSNAHAYGYGGYSGYEGGGRVNPHAWNEFVRVKQRNYDIAHTLDKAPFPQSSSEKNLIKVDLGKLAWGAYDENGTLVKWGSASGGKNYCDDIGKTCKTITGTYTFYRKKGLECKSNQFPVGKGGAPMPYCMHFSGGYALHGGAVPDFNASHGCIRVPTREARWINQNFVKIGKTKVSISYN
jgi:hypothetical protein